MKNRLLESNSTFTILELNKFNEVKKRKNNEKHNNDHYEIIKFTTRYRVLLVNKYVIVKLSLFYFDSYLIQFVR